MKKLKIKVLLMLLSICFIAILTGCIQDPPKEAAILEDMQAFINEYESDQEVTEIIIDKRQTNEDEKEDNIFCQVVIQDQQLEYNNLFYLQYNYYDDNEEWILDIVEPIDKNDWVVRPLVGVDDEKIIYEIDYNSKYITKENIAMLRDYSIVNRETDLESGVDIVTIEIEEKSEFLEISGTVDLVFEFPEYSDYWRLNNIVHNEDYNEKWDIEGQYVCEDYRTFNILMVGSLKMILSINKVENQDVNATLSADFYNRDGEAIESFQDLKMSGKILEGWRSIHYKSQVHDFIYNLELKGGEYVVLASFDVESDIPVTALIGYYNEDEYDFETLRTEKIYKMVEVE